MVSIGRSSPLPFSLSNSNSTSLLSTNNYTISYFPPLSSNKTHKPYNTHLSLNPSSTNPLFTFDKRHNGLLLVCVSALKKPRKGDSPMEMDLFDDDDDDDYDYDDEDGGIFLPFGNMQKWNESKPPGFGEGKVYDTSIEDKLVEEMEQARQAQAVNINKLKNNPGSKKDDRNNQATEVIPSGIRVRLINLPRKKNIHRDLKSAFEEVTGIINIIPAVSGNKKTKDPICKGFAFVDFKSEEDATRFVEIFSRQSIAFGKIQKQIKCEMMNSRSPNSVNEQAAVDTYIVPEPTVPDLEEDPTDSEMDDSSLDLWVETGSDASDDPDDDFDQAKLEDMRKNLESVSVSVQNGGDSMEPATKVQTDSISSNPLERIRALEKKLLAKGRVEKVQKLEVPGKVEKVRKLEVPRKVGKVRKLEVPGSAKRLKIKEKAVLTGVFSKYGKKATSTSKEES